MGGRQLPTRIISMEYNDIKLGRKYWTMKGNYPVEVEVIRMRGAKVHKQIRNITVWHIEKSATHSRFHWDIYNTYENLRDSIFPRLNK